MTTTTIDPNLTMDALLKAYPGARRALFKRYHIGGCSSCGFRPEETLAEVCARNENLPVEEVAEQILASHEEDLKLLVSPVEASELIQEKKGRFVDIRSREEFDAVHIEGSAFFTQNLMHEISAWDREKLVIFIDHQGTRSLDAAAYFSGHGMLNVRALRGGIDAWSCEVDPGLPRYELE